MHMHKINKRQWYRAIASPKATDGHQAWVGDMSIEALKALTECENLGAEGAEWGRVLSLIHI